MILKPNSPEISHELQIPDRLVYPIQRTHGAAPPAPRLSAKQGKTVVRFNRTLVFLVCLCALPVFGKAQPAVNQNPENLPQDILDEMVEHKSSLTLVAPKDEAPVVLIAKSATAAEKFASKELAHHLEMITGRKIGIIKEGDKAPAGAKTIIIGRSDLTKEYPTDSLGEEEYIIDIKPDKLVIVGGAKAPIKTPGGTTYERDRGTIYGVYDFLENLGVRWYRPEPWGIHIPKKETINLTVGRKQSRPPVFLGRCAITMKPSEDSQLADVWSVRQRLNIKIPEKKAPQNEYGGRTRISLGHAYNTIIPPDKYLKSNPEYFALINGERGNVGSGRTPQLCLGNPELQEVFAKTVIEMAKENPQQECIAVDPQDGTQLGTRMCVCPLCVAMDDPANPTLMSNRVFGFTNIIAKKVAAEVPGTKLGLYAYSMHTPAPTLIKRLEPNIIVGIANINSWTDLSKKLLDPNSPQNSRFLELVNDWKKVTPHPLWMREYSSYGWKGAIPMYRLLQDRIKGYRDLGIQGFIWRGEPNRGPQLLLLYLKAQLQWNPDLDLQKELDLFYHNYYGPAALPMKGYHEAWMQAMENLEMSRSNSNGEVVAGGGISSGGRGMHLVCSPRLLTELRKNLIEAQAAIKDQPLYERRLKGDLETYEYSRRIGEILSLKLEDGETIKDPSTPSFSHLDSPKATAAWKSFEEWFQNRNQDDLVFDINPTKNTSLMYMKRDILSNGKYRGWDERQLLMSQGFGEPMPAAIP